MALDKEVRTVLFNSGLRRTQIRKYVFGKGSVSIDEIRSVFGDIDKETLKASIKSMKRDGLISIENGIVTSLETEIKEPKAETAYRAARVLKEFTLKDLALYSGASQCYCSHLVHSWIRKGIAVQVGENKVFSVYRLVLDVPRPMVKKKCSQKEEQR